MSEKLTKDYYDTNALKNVLSMLDELKRINLLILKTCVYLLFAGARWAVFGGLSGQTKNDAKAIIGFSVKVSGRKKQDAPFYALAKITGLGGGTLGAMGKYLPAYDRSKSGRLGPSKKAAKRAKKYRSLYPRVYSRGRSVEQIANDLRLYIFDFMNMFRNLETELSRLRLPLPENMRKFTQDLDTIGEDLHSSGMIIKEYKETYRLPPGRSYGVRRGSALGTRAKKILYPAAFNKIFSVAVESKNFAKWIPQMRATIVSRMNESQKQTLSSEIAKTGGVKTPIKHTIPTPQPSTPYVPPEVTEKKLDTAVTPEQKAAIIAEHLKSEKPAKGGLALPVALAALAAFLG